MKIKKYPVAGKVSQRGGCKVSWIVYSTIEQAEKASKVAQHNAVIFAGWGYDFGYQWPGNIRKVDNGFEVCIP